MGKKSNRISKVPAFVKKILQILQDPQYSEVIEWLPSGNGFQILNASYFSQKVLPKYFKHNNFSSFVRQLNMYGFNRPKDSYQNVYIHTRFQKGNINNMKFIRRKPTQNKEIQEDFDDDQFVFNDSKQHEQNILDEFKKIEEENKRLRKENEELLLGLAQFKELKQKLQRCSEQMSKCISFFSSQSQQEKSQSQVSSLSSSSSVTSSNSKEQSKKGFSLCNKLQEGKQALRYQILLQGSETTEIQL